MTKKSLFNQCCGSTLVWFHEDPALISMLIRIQIQRPKPMRYHADSDPSQTFKKFRYLKQVPSTGNRSKKSYQVTKAFLKGRKPGLFDPRQPNQYRSMRLHIHSTGYYIKESVSPAATCTPDCVHVIRLRAAPPSVTTLAEATWTQSKMWQRESSLKENGKT
jgi:hypothetical protein